MELGTYQKVIRKKRISDILAMYWLEMITL